MFFHGLLFEIEYLALAFTVAVVLFCCSVLSLFCAVVTETHRFEL